MEDVDGGEVEVMGNAKTIVVELNNHKTVEQYFADLVYNLMVVHVLYFSHVEY